MAITPEKPDTKRPHPPVSGRGQAELADTHSDMFFAAVETTRMPMIVTDPHQPDNPIIFANNAFLRMTGYERDELVGYNCRFLQGAETDKDTVSEIRLAIANNREFATEILNYRKDGSTFWNALFISPVFNRSGEVVYFFGSQLDVSRRRDAELALYQAQKMESLGQLTSGIAHDFNNLRVARFGPAGELGDCHTVRKARSEPKPYRDMRAASDCMGDVPVAVTATSIG